MFNRDAAKAAGYSDQEINSYLSSQGGSTPDPQTQVAQQIAQPQPQGKSIGGFFGNLGSDIASNISGLAGLPKLAWDTSIPGGVVNATKNFLQGKGFQNNAGSTMANIATGLVKEYGALASDPAGHFYDHPLSTVLDVAPLVGKVGKIATLAKGADAAKVADVASTLPDIGTAAVDAAGTTGKAADAARATVSPAQLKNFTDMFTVNRRMSELYNFPQTAEAMIQKGMAGKNIDQISQTAKAITGQGGLGTSLVRRAVGQIKGDIVPNSIPAGIESDINQSLLMGDKAANGIRADMLKHFEPGQLPDTVNPEHAFDLAQNWEKRGYEYLHQSTDLHPNAEAEQIGRVYLNGADRLKTALDQAAASQGTVSNTITPADIAKAKSINPSFGSELEQIKNSGGSLSDLRSTQKDWVRISKTIDHSENTANTPFSRLGQGLATAVGASAGSMLGPIGTVGGGIIGSMASPYLEDIAQKVMPGISAAATNAVESVPKAVSGAGGAIGASTKTLPPIGPLVSSGRQDQLPDIGSVQAATTSDPTATQASTWQPSPDGQWKTNAQTGEVLSTDESYRWNPQSNAWEPNQTPLQDSGSSASQIGAINKMMQEDYMTTGGRRLAQLQPLLDAAIAANKAQTDQYGGPVQQGIIDVNNAQNLVSQLSHKFLGKGGIATTDMGTGPVAGRIRAIQDTFGGDSQGRSYEDLRANVVPLIAKILNGGSDRITQETQTRAEKLLPSLTDTRENAIAALNELSIALQQHRKSLMQSTPAGISQQTLPNIPQGGGY